MLLLYDHPTAGKIEAADHLISPGYLTIESLVAYSDDVNSRMEKTDTNTKCVWLLGLYSGVIGVTGFSLFILVAQLVCAREPYHRIHSLFLLTASIGYLAQIVISILLDRARSRCGRG
jgi:hypothetical protein